MAKKGGIQPVKLKIDQSLGVFDSCQPDGDKSTKSSLSVLINEVRICKKNSVDTFEYSINYLSNQVGKEILCKDFPKFFSKSEFINPKTNKKYALRVDDSGEYYIFTNINNEYKKSILETIYKKYNIDIEVSIVDEELIDIVSEIKLTDENDFSKLVDRVINPFGAKKDSAAICISGESGSGKSFRIEKTLTYENHNFIFEILDPTSTGLLTQYQSGQYIRNNIGDFIIDSQNDPSNFYTIVLDECHKDGFIDRINSELLQCLSSKRNDGLRYFQTNKVTDSLFSQLELKNGRRIVPDNVGFILITSKPDIIYYNDDIKNRVDVVHLHFEDREKDFTIENLLKKKEEEEEVKYENQD